MQVIKRNILRIIWLYWELIGGIRLIISDTTIRKIIVDNKEQALDIVAKGIDKYLVDINKQGKVYEINLVSKVGDYFEK